MAKLTEPQYEDLSIVRFGGMNADAPQVALPMAKSDRGLPQFRELRNYRHDTDGTVVTRPGTREFEFRGLYYPEAAEGGHPDPLPATLVPLAKTEYVLYYTEQSGTQAGQQIDFRYDVTLAWNKEQKSVELLLLDRLANDGTTIEIVVAFDVPVLPMANVMQFESLLVVSIYDHATFAAWPATVDVPAGAPPGSRKVPTQWTVEVLGKDVTPSPAAFEFVQSTTGDLILFQAHDGGSEHTLAYDYESESLADGGSSHKEITLALPIDASYLITTDASVAASNALAKWQHADEEPPSIAPDSPKTTLQHYQHRGWYYRFIAVVKKANIDGTTFKEYCHPSTDIFVREVLYAPFFWSKNDGTFPNAVTADSDPARWFTQSDPPPVPDFLDTFNAYPSTDAFTDLQTKYRTYMGSMATNESPGGTAGIYWWVSRWLGWRGHGAGQNAHFDHRPPYKLEVPAHELKGAPMVNFKWSDFGAVGALGGLPPGTVEIRVYRTAYRGVSPKTRDTDTPLFQPHLYGYVGSIAPGADDVDSLGVTLGGSGPGTFLDDVKKPDFGDDPLSYDAYLRGAFSGEVLSTYGQSPVLVLGNVRTDYSLLTPSKLAQCSLVATDLTTTGYSTGDYGLATDGLPAHCFHYAYQDDEGYRSPAVAIAAPDNSNVLTGASHGILFTFPQGYDPAITHIILYESIMEGSVRHFYEVATIACDPGRYFSIHDEARAEDLTGRHLGDMPKFYEPGAIIYSQPKDPWFWKPGDAEIHHETAPVRAMLDLMGELCVETDTSLTLTQLRRDPPKSERETKWTGCIAREANAKVAEAGVFLSQHGLYLMVPSRPEAIAWDGTSELRRYLQETIPGEQPLANVRRASAVYFDRYKEFWLHIPSSIDLWPSDRKNESLPHRTFVLKLFDASLEKIEYATFDLTPYFEIKNVPPFTPPDLPPGAGDPVTLAGPAVVDITTYRPNRVFFSAGSDGSLFASYGRNDGMLVTANLDESALDYQGSAAWTLALGMGRALGRRQLVATVYDLTARGTVNIMTGIPKPTGIWDAVRGNINDTAQVYNIRTIKADVARQYYHPAIDRAVETKGNTILVRMLSKPDRRSRHKVALRGFGAFLDDKHYHP